TRADLQSVGLAGAISIPEHEFVVIQGVADLVRIAPREIWLIDFKSDRLEPKDLKAAADRYKPQLALYSTALSALYKRPLKQKGIFFLSLRQFEWFNGKKTKSQQQLESSF